MSGRTRRVCAERDLWSAVWQQIETFLDRVDSLAEQDADHVTPMQVLLPVIDVIERARRRADGFGLNPAVAVAPRGVGLVAPMGLTFDPHRVPGPEECEVAVAAHAVPDGASSPSLGDDPPLFLMPSVTLASFRDDKHATHVQLITPAYDFGRLDALVTLAGTFKQGLFPKDVRQKAVNGEEFAMVKWSAVRAARVEDLRGAYKSADAPSIAADLAALPTNAPLDDYRRIGRRCAAAAAETRTDRDALRAAHDTLQRSGGDDQLIGRLAAAADLLATVAGRYDAAATALGTRGFGDLVVHRGELVGQLVLADQPRGPGVALELRRVDESASATLDTEVDARIAYPDGPLRMLRLLEQTLRFFWSARRAWMGRRHALLTRPLLTAYFAPWIDSLRRVVHGGDSGVVLPAGTHLAALAQVRSRELVLTGAVPEPFPAAGRLLYLGGDRPTAAIIVDRLGDGTRVAITPLTVSVEAGATLRGTPGLVAAGVPVGGDFPTITEVEWRRGRSRFGREADGVLEALLGHAGRLALLLGGPGGFKDRDDAPGVPAPYPAIDHFAVEAPVAPSATRLFVTTIPSPAASGTGDAAAIVRPGELVLVRGADDDGVFWQTVAEVDRAELVTGAEARADDAASANPTPPCCADAAPVIVIHLRSIQLPTDVTLVRAIRLHRDFRGFGYRSLLARAVLPEVLDGETATIQVTDGATTKAVRRDPELKVAVRVFEDWLGPDARTPS